MKNISEIRKMTQDELNTELMTLRKKQFNLRMQKANGSLEKTHVFAQVRREIARVKTIMSEKGGCDGNQ